MSSYFSRGPQQLTPSVKLITMVTESNGMLPFLCIQLLNRAPQIKTKVYIKPKNKGFYSTARAISICAINEVLIVRIAYGLVGRLRPLAD